MEWRIEQTTGISQRDCYYQLWKEKQAAVAFTEASANRTQT